MSPSSKRPARIPVEERLFSLVLALVATEAGLTKPEILATVQGYRQRYDPSGDNASLERQFERDKDDIRELGVPLETLEAPGEAGDNRRLRYRIPRGDYDLPAEITFTPQEMALLSLSATVWQEGSLSAESRRALTKLRSLGVDSDDPVLGYAPRIRVREAAFEPLTRALERHAVVSFDYLKPGDEHAGRRTVRPLALVQHHGRWHLYGLDEGPGEPRTFLLARIASRVVVGERVVDPGPGDFAATALAELDEVWRRNLAIVEVEPASDAAVRLRKREGTREAADGVLELSDSDPALLADELAGYGPEVRVRAPESLAAAVRERLRLVAALHGEETDG